MKLRIAIALLVHIIVVAVVLPVQFNALAQEPPFIRVIDATTGLPTISLGNPYEPIPPHGFPFTVNVTLTVTTPITNFMAFQIAMKYNITFVNCTAAWMERNDPSFVFYKQNPVVVTPQIVSLPNSSYVYWGATRLLAKNLSAGQYLLGQVNFTAYRWGISLLQIIPTYTVPQPPPDYPDDSFLLDLTGENPHPIPFTFENCLVTAVSSWSPPVALFSFSPTDPKPLQNITFDASASFDPELGPITSYQWDFGDNTDESTNTSITTHVYTIGGLYTVNLTVTDFEGLHGSVAHTLQVEDVIPEFPSFLLLPLFMIATLLAITLCRRRTKTSDIKREHAT